MLARFISYLPVLLLIWLPLHEIHSSPDIGLYFQLGEKTYLPGETVDISDIGEQPNYRSDPGSTLVCVTTNVNKKCCRRSDGERVGEWYFPNGTVVPRLAYYQQVYRTVYAEQVRLARLPAIFGPTGIYYCRVPNSAGALISAGIKIVSNSVNSNISLTYSEDVVNVHGEVSINCSVLNQIFGSSPSILLYTPNGVIITSDLPGIALSNGEGWTSVEISALQLSHAGEYSCKINGTLFSETVTKWLCMRLNPPESVILIEPHQPVYATTSRVISVFVQFHYYADIIYYLNIFWNPFSGSTQHVKVLQVNVTGRTSYTGEITLNSLGVNDSGNYTSSVFLSSPDPYFVESYYIRNSGNLNVRAVPEIEVAVSGNRIPKVNVPYVLTCMHGSSDDFFTYRRPSFVWKHNGIIMNGQQSPVLLFSHLSLQEVGNYVCEVTANFNPIGRPIYGISSPHSIILQAPSPASVTLQVVANSVYAGSSPQLFCATTFPNYENIIFTVTMELQGPNFTLTEQAMKNTSVQYVTTFSISDITSNQAGDYNCTVVAGGMFFLESPYSVSNSIALFVVGLPPSPTILFTNSYFTSINFTWSIPQTEILDYFEIKYRFTIRGCDNTSNGTIIIEDISTRSYQLNGLEENSDVTIILSGVNQAGRNSSSLNTTTLPRAPSSGPLLSVISSSSTSITLAWEPIPCHDKNMDSITSYRINISGDLGGDFEITTDELEYKVTGLIPRANYTFHIFPVYNASFGGNVRTSIVKATTKSNVVGFFINGSILSNNSLLMTHDIGVNNLGLFCLTNLSDCCEYPYSSTAKGSWKYPNQSSIPYNKRNIVHQSKYASSVILHFKTDQQTEEFSGVFTCTIPDSRNIMQNLYIYVADRFTDLFIDVLEYNRSSSVLTCISKGRPVDSVKWLRDGQIIEEDDSRYSISQTVMEGTISSYEHNLSNKYEIEGRYTCKVKDVYGHSDSKTLMINNCPAGQYGAVAFDGSTVCIACPANSMSISEGSNQCGCLLGYYRNFLEDKNFPCTRPPSNCQNLRIAKNSTIENVELVWNRPQITGRNDLYYNVYLGNTDGSEELEKMNSYPIMTDFATINYILLSKLRPLSKYTVKVTVHNGVSEMDPSEESSRMCEITWTTPK